MSQYEELKARARLYKAGSIVPRKLLRCTKRKAQHLFTFYSDTYVIPRPGGYLAFTEGLPDFVLKQKTGNKKLGKNFTYRGSPYHSGRPGFRGTEWHVRHPADSIEEFQERVLAAMLPQQIPSAIRWIDNQHEKDQSQA